MSRLLIYLYLVFLLLCSILLRASDHVPVRIEINSSWGGLGQPSKGNLVITGVDGKYSSAGRKVDASLVEALLTTFEEPTVDRPSPESCGVSKQWLLDNYISGLQDYTHERLKALSPKQVELFKFHFTDTRTVQAAFGELFKNGHTDDYPEMSVTVNRSGKIYGVQSNSQYPFMLPWAGIDHPRGGYNCHISFAIAALLPRQFSNRSRLLLNESFRWDLTQHVMGSLKHEWDMLDTESKVGPEVAPIFEHYTPVKSAISNLSSIDLDGGQAWNAELRSKGLPANLIVGVSLRYYKKKLFGADEFLSQLPKYTNLVLSVPWLMHYLQTQPNATMELRYVNGQSLSAKATASLVEDLRKHGKSFLADAVAQQTARTAFIEVNAGSGCWSRAVVFPTKEVLLWHFKCDSPLGFAAKDFDAWDYYGWRSTGTIVKLDQTLTK